MKLLLTIATTLLIAVGANAAELGDDGLHKAAWLQDTFKDMAEDLEEANADGKRLMVIIEQRGCIYCKKMHEEVFVVPAIEKALTDDFFVVQINMFGDVEVTDFDGTTLPEKDMVSRWGALFTPTMMFFPPDMSDGMSAKDAAVVTVPGAFGKHTTMNMLNWVLAEGYLGDEPFQKYHARMLASQ